MFGVSRFRVFEVRCSGFWGFANVVSKFGVSRFGVFEVRGFPYGVSRFEVSGSGFPGSGFSMFGVLGFRVRGWGRVRGFVFGVSRFEVFEV